MLPKWFTPLLVALIAGLSIWLLPEQQEQQPLPINRGGVAVDTFMENFTTQVLDSRGRPQYILRARHMEHYPHDGHSELEQPLLTLYQDDEQWTVSAARGVLEKNNEKIMLHGEVMIDKHLRDDPAPVLQIQTRELLVLPPQSYAETDQQTRIIQGNSTIDSRGVRAFFEEKRIQLLSQVRGVYETRP